jgi:hypothetical protein
VGRDGTKYGFDLGQAETKIFFQTGPDRWNQIDPAREFFLQARNHKSSLIGAAWSMAAAP